MSSDSEESGANHELQAAIRSLILMQPCFINCFAAMSKTRSHWFQV